MADYFPVVSRAVAGLENNTGEARRAVYERARAAIVKQLRAIDPPLSEEDVSRERMSLEEAIRRVEAEAAPARASDLRPAPAAPRSEPIKPAPVAPARPSPMAGPKGAPYVAEAPKPSAPDDKDVKPAADASAGSVAKPGQAQIAAAKPTGPSAAKTAKRPDGRPIIAAGSRQDGPPKKKGSGVAIPLIAIAVVLVGSGAFIARDRIAGLFGGSTTEVAQQEQPAATQPTATEPAQQEGKSDDRLPQDGVPAASPPEQAQQPERQAAREDAAPAPVAPTAVEPSAPPASQSGPLVAQRATLYEEGPNQQSGEALAGSVLWRTDSVAAGQGQPLETAIRGEIEIPARKLRATMTIRRNADATLPASHTIEIQFDLPPDFPNAGVANVPGVVMKADESARGATVAGLSVRVTSGFFLIGLSNLETERTVNEQLLRDRGWIDVPILYDNGRRAVLTLEKGTPGTQAFNDAFNSWRTGPAAAAQP